MKQKQKTLKIIRNTYCRLQPSKIEGIGIFAIRTIPKDANPFYGVKKHIWQKVESSKLRNLDENIKKMISDFFAMDKNNNFFIPECGLNCIDISFFLNTSKKPNIKTIDEGINFISLREIKKGEELTVSYADYDNRYANK